MEAIRRREWLRLGRGSYEYDDDRWRSEFSQAIDEVIEAAEPLRKIAADWSDCPTDPKEIAAALQFGRPDRRRRDLDNYSKAPAPRR